MLFFSQIELCKNYTFLHSSLLKAHLQFPLANLVLLRKKPFFFSVSFGRGEFISSHWYNELLRHSALFWFC